MTVVSPSGDHRTPRHEEDPFREHRRQREQLDAFLQTLWETSLSTRHHATGDSTDGLIRQGYQIRPLFLAEIQTLQKQHNTLEWEENVTRRRSGTGDTKSANGTKSAVTIHPNEENHHDSRIQLLLPTEQFHQDQSHRLQRVKHCHFGPYVTLWIRRNEDMQPTSQEGTPSSHHLLQYVHVERSVLCLQSHISHVALLQEVIIDHDAHVHHVGSMARHQHPDHQHHPYPNMAQGRLHIHVGPEAGSSIIPLQLDIEDSMIQVTQQLDQWAQTSSSQPHDAQQNTHHATSSVNATNSNVMFTGSYLAPFSRVTNTQALQSSHVSSYASIDNATRVTNSFLFPHAHIRDAAVVQDTALQWNSLIQQSHVHSCLLMEQAAVGPSSTVSNSVLGPDVHVSAGEVHHCILGPNTNAHHQSLLISVLWPLGRGNVGYGANVGSNHTGRIPDQQAYAGEGVFWGLSSVVKFPVSMAPYCLVAAGTTVSPQKVQYPFSLLVDQMLIPGWVLQSSPYTLYRNQIKFANRRKAQRHSFYTGYTILRPSTIEACRQARSHLPRDSQLTPKARETGQRAYTQCIQRYALNLLLERCLESDKTVGSIPDWITSATPLSSLPEEGTWPWNEPDEWSYASFLLKEEFPSHDVSARSIRDFLSTLIDLEHDFVARLVKCKRKDDERARQIIRYHKDSWMDDPVLKQAQLELQEKEERIQLYMKNIAVATASKL